VLRSERHVDNQTPLARAIEDGEQPAESRGIQSAVAAHELWTFGRVRPDADAVEPGVFQELKICDDVCRAHRAEVRDECEEARRIVDDESVAGDRQALSRGGAHGERERRNSDETDQSLRLPEVHLRKT